MSAKGIGAPSIVADNYPTYADLVVRLIEASGDVASAILDVRGGSGFISEPTAGDGAILRVFANYVPASRMRAVEVREACRPRLDAMGLDSVTIGNVFSVKADEPARLNISNPPFTCMDALVAHLRPTSRVLALLGRATWLYGAQKRSALIRDVGHPDVFGAGERPCFVRVEYRDEVGALLAEGSTDSVGVAWYVWSGPPKEEGRARMLRDATPEEEAARRPPRRVITVRAEDWAKRGKKADIVREEMIDG